MALVFGWPDWDENVVNAPIVRRGEIAQSDVWLERAIDLRGVPAVTRFQVEDRLELPKGRLFGLECLAAHWAHSPDPVHFHMLAFRCLVIRSMREGAVIT
jgi:hypothetical protein